MIPLLPPVDLSQMPAPLREMLERLAYRVIANLMLKHSGDDLLVRVYLAGVFHGKIISEKRDD